MAAGSSSFMLAAARAKRAGAVTHEDTLEALVAFVVPGSDPYSVAQGESSPNPGGVDAGIADILIETLDAAGPAPPPFPTTSIAVAAILDQVSQLVNPSATGFGDLLFVEKVFVFQALESDPAAAPLAGLLPPVVAGLSLSEAGVFDQQSRSLTGQPVGWDLTGYPGVADGRDELVGYYQDRKKATG
jgi:hypothetical protein